MNKSSTSKTEKNAPIASLRIGRIKAAVWENEGPEGKKFHSVTFSRSYRDESGAYHDTDSFDRNDLLVVAKLADRAHTVIYERLGELKAEAAD